jgi:hypothetical protein
LNNTSANLILTHELALLQALRKVTDFVTSTVVPGAEVGFLCGAAMYAQPELAAQALVPPLAEKVLRLLEGTERTGAAGADPNWVKEKGNKKVGLLRVILMEMLCFVLYVGGGGIKDSM